MQSWVNVAVLARTYNLEGGFVARPAADLPFLLEEGMHVALVPPQIDAPRNVTVASVEERGDGSALLFFREITDASTAALVAGCSCLVHREDVAEALEELVEDFPFLDWAVEDVAAGEVGTVVDFQEVPGQVRLVVETPEGREVLIPLVEEFVEAIDEEGGRLVLSLPAGLLEL